MSFRSKYFHIVDKHICRVLVVVIFFSSCTSRGDKAILSNPELMHGNQKQLTEVIIHDVFSPPVASRIYAYTSLAAYEAIRFHEKGYPSLTAQLHGFPVMPEPEKNKSYNFLLAATKSFMTVAEKVTFSVDSLKAYVDPVYAEFQSHLDEETFNNSIAFGESVGKKILERTKLDNYQKTRGMPKNIGSNDAGKWRPTPPDYMDGAEPYWGQILCLAMDSSLHFKASPPPVFSTDTTSEFYKVAYEVYSVGKNLTEEEKLIAKYWDDNPFVVEHSGHTMFANKKITPVGHWMGITTIASKMKKLNPVETVQAYCITAIAVYDGFINCWHEKFRDPLLRPITAINEMIDPKWQPLLQTPPFPEHTSGHSTISAAAATVLTKRFGENFAFEDTSDLEYIGMKRNFTSFMQAAMEASISRLYGGIHYRTGIEEGTKQGIRIGEYINNKIKLRE